MWNKHCNQLFMQFPHSACKEEMYFPHYAESRTFYLFSSFHRLSCTASCNPRDGHKPHLSAQVSDVIGYRLYLLPPPPINPLLKTHTVFSSLVFSALESTGSRGETHSDWVRLSWKSAIANRRGNLFKTITWFHWESKWSSGVTG